MLLVKNLFAGYNGVNVLKNISFTLSTGEKLAVIGPNGCGKTTLLRAVANIIPYTGEISADGAQVCQMPRKEIARKIAMLSQITQISFTYSVYDTVMMGRYAHRRFLSTPGDADTEAVDKALKAVHMHEHRDRDITRLSGGQLQRVFLAKLLAQEPEIILLDEPTNHLDLSYQVELIEYLSRWAAETKRAVIGVLHDINLAIDFADSVLLLKDGAQIYLGETKGLSSGVLESVFNMDVVSYMKNSLKRWETVL